MPLAVQAHDASLTNEYLPLGREDSEASLERELFPRYSQLHSLRTRSMMILFEDE